MCTRAVQYKNQCTVGCMWPCHYFDISDEIIPVIRNGLKVFDVMLSLEGERSLKWVWYKEWAEGV